MERINSFVTKLMIRVMNRHSDEEGQTLVEYGLIVALISIVAIAALELIGSSVTDVFNSVGTTLDNATS
ncbi:MAG TPA: Flp family type IVb pilin [Dehalococcoidia bacterium]